MTTLLYSQKNYNNRIVYGGDPDYNKVSLLLHCDGANNSTAIIDNSPSQKAVTAYGNAKISTAQSKFGGASVLFDGAGDYLDSFYVDDFNFITTDFTIELQAYPTATKVARFITLCGSVINWNGTTGIHWYFGQNNQNVDFTLSNNTATPVGATSTGNLLTINSWNHIAISKSGSTGYFGINGTVSSFSLSGAATPTGTPKLAIATITGENGAGSNAYAGYMDEIRITKGVARYTANYTPPTASFTHR